MSHDGLVVVVVFMSGYLDRGLSSCGSGFALPGVGGLVDVDSVGVLGAHDDDSIV